MSDSDSARSAIADDDGTGSPSPSMKAFLDCAPDAVLLLDRAGVVVRVNPAAQRLFGEAGCDLVGSTIESQLSETSANRFVEKLRQLGDPAAENAGAAAGELHTRFAAVEKTVFSLRLSLVEDRDRRFVVCWVRDLTDRLRHVEIADQLSTLIESTDDAIIGTDLAGAITVWNAAAEKLYGYGAAEVLGQNAANLTVAPVREEEIDRITAELMAHGTVRRFETERLRKDGSPVDVSLSISLVHDHRGEPVGTLAIAHDITERKRAEAELLAARDELEQRVERRTANLREANRRLENEIAERRAAQAELRHAERLAAIGTLAAGIAHELNNPLGLITLEVHHARDNAGDTEQMRASLDEIERDATRCAQIVSGVLRFARQEGSTKSPGDLNGSLRKAVSRTGGVRRDTGVQIETFLAEPLPRVLMNADEIEQLLINLINNAAQASPSGSRIRVSTGSGANGVRLRVCDRGRGMSEKQRAHACDPFYTTRAHEGGTGLGLSICHGIVADHGGEIEIESCPGNGTRVTVTLPVAESDGSRRPDAVTASRPAPLSLD